MALTDLCAVKADLPAALEPPELVGALAAARATGAPEARGASSDCFRVPRPPARFAARAAEAPAVPVAAATTPSVPETVGPAHPARDDGPLRPRCAAQLMGGAVALTDFCAVKAGLAAAPGPTGLVGAPAAARRRATGAPELLAH